MDKPIVGFHTRTIGPEIYHISSFMNLKKGIDPYITIYVDPCMKDALITTPVPTGLDNMIVDNTSKYKVALVLEPITILPHSYPWISKNDDKFDFVFIDGDHQRSSLLKDLELSKRLSDPPHYMLLDDVHDYVHDSATVFHEEIKPKYNHYTFENWKDNEKIRSSKWVNDVDEVMAGTALIWEKQ